MLTTSKTIGIIRCFQSMANGRELGSNNQAGRTVYTYYDNTTDELYTAADGGQIWKGNIGSENWHSINDHIKISAIRYMTKFYEASFTRLLVHSGGWNKVGIMYSDDDGESWELASGLDNIVSWGFIKRAVVQTNTQHSIYIVAQEWDYSAWKASVAFISLPIWVNHSA